MITVDQLRAMALGRPKDSNMVSVVDALNRYGSSFGLAQPHRLAHYLAQLLHESASFKYDREIWGPTPAQQRYDTRTDLGNTPDRDGDGKKYRGRGPIQVTGRDNYRQFTRWAKTFDPAAPNFEKDPDAIVTDPWEGLAPIWYWDTRGLNVYADQNNIEMVTRRINGGLNGFDGRVKYYGRAALVLLGYGTSTEEVERFQADRGLVIDGIIGQNTRMSLHQALKGHNPYERTIEKKVTVPKPEVPKQVDEEVKKKTNRWGWLTSIFGGGGVGAGFMFGMPWQGIVAILGGVLVLLIVIVLLRKEIISAVGDIRKAVEA